MLLYIEDKILLAKVIEYFEYIKKDYTLNPEETYEYVLLADISKKSMEVSNGKKIIFITYLIEKRLRETYVKNNKRNREYRNRVVNNLNNFYKVIVSTESIKNLLAEKVKTNIDVINKELPIINISNTNKYIYDKYNIKRRRKNILFIDFNYEKLDYIYALASKYTKINFIYIGFVPDFNLTKKNKSLLNKLPNNIYKIRNYDFNTFNDFLKISNMVINVSDLITDIEYLYSIFLFKKSFLSLTNVYYNGYLINSKHIYIFEGMKELFLKFEKIMENRVSNLTLDAYDLISNNTFSEVARRYSIYLP